MNSTRSAENSLADYEIVRETGRGAMSTVYEATDRRDGRTVALKVLHAPATLSLPQQQSLIARLGREARLVARLSHPNIVRILDVGEEGGRHFLAMEYLRGTTLRERLDRGPLSLTEASHTLDQIADALDAIHAQKIVHRDIKPSNVMLLPEGVVKLMDFGIARQGDDTTITQTGMIVGSPAYMAPEQIRGENGDPASDLWALGVLLYEMLSGHSPWSGGSIPAVLYKVTHDAPPPIPGLSPQVQQVLRRAMDKNPARRYRTASDFAAALRGTWQPAVRPPLPFAPLRKPRLLLPLLGVIVLLAAGGAARLSVRHRTASPMQVAAVAPRPASPSEPLPIRITEHSIKPPVSKAPPRKTMVQIQKAAKAKLRFAKAKLKAAKHSHPGRHNAALHLHSKLSPRRTRRVRVFHGSRPAYQDQTQQLQHFIYNY